MPNYRADARRAALRYGLDPHIFERQIQQESGFNPNARSPAGAQGIAQIMPATARGWGVDPSNPRQALNAAAKNMASYVKRYGSYRNALVAYNAGPGRVGKPLYAETANYVRTILGGKDPGRLSSPRSGGAQAISGAPGTPGGVDMSGGSQGVSALLAGLAQQKPQIQSAGIQSPAFSAQAPMAGQVPVSGGGPAPKVDVGSLLEQIRTQGGMPAAGGVSPGAAVLTAGTDSGLPKNDAVAALKAEASKINDARVPYLWGGGHGGKTTGKKVTPLDCSGAVSRVLGINPRVSGQFESWGGAGKGKRVTIYANSGHVLMEIDGHFFGTSKTNSGGGAGWIPRAAISASYLKNFTARHPKGM